MMQLNKHKQNWLKIRLLLSTNDLILNPRDSTNEYTVVTTPIMIFNQQVGVVTNSKQMLCDAQTGSDELSTEIRFWRKDFILQVWCIA